MDNMIKVMFLYCKVDVKDANIKEVNILDANKVIAIQKYKERMDHNTTLL